MVAHFCQQCFPFLNKGVGLLFEQKAYLVSYHISISLNNIRQIHEGVVQLARLVDNPRFLGLAQEMLQALADNGATNVQHEVGHILIIVANQHDRLVVARIHGLTCNQHRTLRLHEHSTHVA